MRSKVAITILLLQSVWLVAQQPSASQPQNTPTPEPKLDLLEHWRLATVSLGQEVTDGNVHKYVTVGSAVIVALDQRSACLLTAKHVIFDPEHGYVPFVVRMRFPKNAPSATEDMGIDVPLIDGARTLWQSLTDGSDLAVVPLPDITKYRVVHAVGIQDFGGEDDIYQGAAVLLLGYPEILGPQFQTTPIARGGIIAWIDPDGGANKAFLIDANVFNGNSGGPVFRVRSGFDSKGNFNVGGGYSFIGIVTKDAYEMAPVHVGEQPIRQIDPTTGKVIPFAAKVLNIGGIGIVEPVSKARKLVIKMLHPFSVVPMQDN